MCGRGSSEKKPRPSRILTTRRASAWWHSSQANFCRRLVCATLLQCSHRFLRRFLAKFAIIFHKFFFLSHVYTYKNHVPQVRIYNECSGWEFYVSKRYYVNAALNSLIDWLIQSSIGLIGWFARLVRAWRHACNMGEGAGRTLNLKKSVDAAALLIFLLLAVFLLC